MAQRLAGEEVVVMMSLVGVQVWLEEGIHRQSRSVVRLGVSFGHVVRRGRGEVLRGEGVALVVMLVWW